MDDAPLKVEGCYGASSYQAQCAFLLTAFAELEPLSRPQADAMDGAPRSGRSAQRPLNKKGRAIGDLFLMFHWLR